MSGILVLFNNSVPGFAGVIEDGYFRAFPEAIHEFLRFVPGEKSGDWVIYPVISVSDAGYRILIDDFRNETKQDRPFDAACAHQWHNDSTYGCRPVRNRILII